MRKIEGTIIAVTIIIVAISAIVIMTSENSIVHKVLSTHTANIVDATIVVPPSQYVSYPIIPPSGSKNCKIQGTFLVRRD